MIMLIIFKLQTIEAFLYIESRTKLALNKPLKLLVFNSWYAKCEIQQVLIPRAKSPSMPEGNEGIYRYSASRTSLWLDPDGRPLQDVYIHGIYM